MKKLATLLLLAAAALCVSGAGKLRLTDATGSGLAAFSRLAFAFATPRGTEIAYHRLEVSAALEKLAAGETDIVLLKSDDIPPDFSGTQTVCAYRALAAVVNMRNPLRGITRNHLKRLLTEPRPSWDHRGGSGAPVHRAALKGRDGKPAGFGQLHLFRSASGILILESVEQLWLFVGANPGALAVTPFTGDLPDGLIPLKIDGVAPTRTSIRDGKYPLTETFAAVTVRDPPAPVRDFLRELDGRGFADLLEEEWALAKAPSAIFGENDRHNDIKTKQGGGK